MTRVILTAMFLLITVFYPAAVSAQETETVPASGDELPEIVLEAEEGSLLGGASARTAGGTGYVTGFKKEGDGVTLSLEVSEDGFYDITVSSCSEGGHKENRILVDGENAGLFVSEDKGYAEDTLDRIYLGQGRHEVSLMSYWGWVKVDKVTVSRSAALPEDIYEVSPVPVNPNASDNARRLKAYLADVYGKKLITGQYCEQGMYGLENASIWRTTGGDYPAILGMDLIDYSPSRTENGTQGKTIDYALDYWEDKGGIVTLCWHWTAPTRYVTGKWYSAFYTEHTDIDLAKIMNGEDEEGYRLLMSDLDEIAGQLKRLSDADVPILWRPLHEASGGWFWWGAAGPEAYLKLYRLMYEKFTEEYGLNNLLWVWNGQDGAWYPGDDVVDIIGEDIYPGEHVYSSQSDTFLKALGYTDERKMIILSENGCMPDPELLFRDQTVWGSFCTWEGEFVLASAGFNKLSEKYTEAEMVKKIYTDERIVKRSNLPDLKTYPIPDPED